MASCLWSIGVTVLDCDERPQAHLPERKSEKVSEVNLFQKKLTKWWGTANARKEEHSPSGRLRHLPRSEPPSIIVVFLGVKLRTIIPPLLRKVGMNLGFEKFDGREDEGEAGSAACEKGDGGFWAELWELDKSLLFYIH
ncbi:hypothetical protein RIF29_00659 [Crotalaria pallida]|uniref:Uncharacterized protein n=1 Tax=Crotalaria pallida TaxID=3830 RepID=A0AAN9IWD2_CROPI